MTDLAPASTPEFDLRRLRAALRRLENESLSGFEKGVPPGCRLMLDEIPAQGWRLRHGEVATPALLLRRSATDHNIALMQRACDEIGAWLAPHGKTTMSPQLWKRQLEAGAWAITVSTVAHVEVCRRFAIPRVLLANELVGRPEIAYLANMLGSDADLDLYVLVDSVAGVRLLADGLGAVRHRRQLSVLVEFGAAGGRCGVRTIGELTAVAQAVARESSLSLRGVEGYEAVVSGRKTPPPLAAIDSYLERLRDAARAIAPLCTERPLVSAGGSQYPDRVLEILGRAHFPECQLLVRSGGYITHDHGLLQTLSPHGSVHPRLRGRLEPALELWSAVLSRPEPGLAILGMGRRDAAHDAGLPLPVALARRGGTIEALDAGWEVFQMYDQHALLRLPIGSTLEPGDLVGCGISHPCSAFDRWRVVLEVDDNRNVIGAIRTFF